MCNPPPIPIAIVQPGLELFMRITSLEAILLGKD
jgi:hypothetical protein